MANKLNCDVCELQRASYYCEADEAYLCAGCDSSVHGANTLASRHKRVALLDENMTQESEGDGVCPVQAFPDAGLLRTALEFPVGGIKIGDITFARVSNGLLSRKEEEDLHQVPRFVPVAQELPSLEPFRFHALAIAGGPPRRDSKFISLFDGEADHGVDMGEHKRLEESATQENLGVVPELPPPQLGELPVKGPKADKEREARVNRYREKRRTRMFSKKIRYEVRKIYAENRPRLKGRFVRRSNEMESLQCLWPDDQGLS